MGLDWLTRGVYQASSKDEVTSRQGFPRRPRDLIAAQYNGAPPLLSLALTSA